MSGGGSAPPSKKDEIPAQRSPDPAGSVNPTAMDDPAKFNGALDQLKTLFATRAAAVTQQKAKLQQAGPGLQQGAAQGISKMKPLADSKGKLEQQQSQIESAKSEMDATDSTKTKDVSSADVKRGEKAKDEADGLIDKQPQTIDEAKEMVARGKNIAQQARKTPQKRSWWSRFESWFYRKVIAPLTRLFSGGKQLLARLSARMMALIGKATGLDKVAGDLTAMSEADKKRLALTEDNLNKESSALAKAQQGIDKVKQEQ